MSDAGSDSPVVEIVVTVRYWAGAKALAGVEADVLTLAEPATVSDVVSAAVAKRATLRDVVAACSVLVDEAPLGARDSASWPVADGAVVDLLPPFAGG